ncbi:MAG: ATP-dependent zinc protease [Bacteriovoracaceae bacterium]|nr:ATP-dependent zinc protease [Bacteriovoracaceae bacterium]
MDCELNKESKIIGWREWASLPELGLVAIKGKIDSGAKTSSLHAYDIEIEEKGGKTYVLFKVHPLQHDFSVVINCRALLVDRRQVTDSGGHKEERYVIRTSMVLAGVKKTIELTLTNRESMKYRMLIGRAALKHYYIDPSQSYLSGKTIKQKRFLKELKLEMGKA